MHPFQWGRMHIHLCWDGKAVGKKDKATEDLHQLCSDIFYLISVWHTVRDQKKEKPMKDHMVWSWGPDCILLWAREAELLRSCSASRSTCISVRRSSHWGGTHFFFLPQPHQGKSGSNRLWELLLSLRKQLLLISSFLAPLVLTSLCLLPPGTRDWRTDLC